MLPDAYATAAPVEPMALHTKATSALPAAVQHALIVLLLVDVHGLLIDARVALVWSSGAA